MKLKQIASNMTEVRLNDSIVVLFSYETPVAFVDNNGLHITQGGTLDNGQDILSRTTNRHINKWIESLQDRHFDVSRDDSDSIDQSVLDELVK